MSSEEKLRLKQEEEEPDKQMEDQKQNFNENKQVLIDVGPYDENVIIREENNEKISESNIYESNQKEEHSGNQIEDQGEKFIESKKALLAAGPYDEQISAWDGEKEGKIEVEETDLEENLNMYEEKKVKNSLSDELGIIIDQDSEIKDVDKFIKETNINLETGEDLEPRFYSALAKLDANGSYPNIALVYKKDGSKSVELLDRGLYDKLMENQNLGNYRLEWQRFWFEGIKKIDTTPQGRKTFLLDLSDEKELPVSMRRIYLARNSYTWNTLAPNKRELQSENIKGFVGTLFGNRSKFSDFENVKDFTYQNKMNFVWKEFQRIFSKDIQLKTTKRPALFALKGDYTRENVEQALIGTFWKYHNNLDRIAKRNMKDWGYNNLLQYMERKATGVYPSIVDPNYIGQNFIIRVVDKGKAFSRFLGSMDEIKGTDPKYQITKIYQSWIVNSELLQSKSIPDVFWGVNKARATRYINFDKIAHLMSERNAYGINAVLESFFEDRNVIKALNSYFGPRFSESASCSPKGNARVNSGAESIAYPDLVMEKIDMQIKDLGKCSDKDKKALVLIDQFKSFFSPSEDIDKITIHVINGLDLKNVYDVNSYPNMTQNNVGIINIGVWNNIEGINKFGEIFSALRLTHDTGLTGEVAFDNVLKYFYETGQSFSKTDEKTLKKLQELWTDDPAELVINICENFGKFFQDKLEEEEGIHTEIMSNSLQKGNSEYTINNKLPMANKRMKEISEDPSKKFGLLQSQLQERPLFQTFWNECTGVIDVIDKKYRNGPRGFIIDLTADTSLPDEHQKVYMVKNSNRWNIHGYDDKPLFERQFDDFINLYFRKTSVRRDFGKNTNFPNYIWDQIVVNSSNNIMQKPDIFRPSIYALKEKFINNNLGMNKKTINSSDKLVSPENLVKYVNKQIKSGSECDKEQLKNLYEIANDKGHANLALIKSPKGNLSIEFLEPRIYNRLKSNLRFANNRLSFQRYWFECTNKIEVLTPKNNGTPRGLIVDLSSDDFLPNEHKKVYMVKNSTRWNAFGYKDNLLSEGNFDDFTTTLFTKKRIKDFGHREYPRYIWEQIQKEWKIKDRTSFELKSQKYRPNIYVLQDDFSRETVEHVMIGVYTEYVPKLTNDQRRSLKKKGFRNLTSHFNHSKNVPKVLRFSEINLQDFDKILEK